MYEHMEILPKYMLKCHLGPTKTQKKKKKNTMGQSPINKIKEFWHENKFSQPLSKNNLTLEILESKA